MRQIVETRQLPANNLALSDFEADGAFASTASVSDGPASTAADLIHGVGLRSLGRNNDRRGHLTELFSEPTDAPDPVVHVYQVLALPGSIRAWVYHRHQRDRLSYTEGNFQVALYDLRPDSPTFQRLNLLRVGSENPVFLEIPPFVVHGVFNAGTEAASFINMPTAVWRRDAPDKYRIPYPDPRLPFSFT